MAGSWTKLGRIYDPADHVRSWSKTHACVPTSLPLPGGERVRLYFSPRNERGQSELTYLEVDANDPTQVLYVHDAPIMDLGELGTFDDGGIMPCSALWVDDEVWLYYVGWNPSASVPYRNAVGLAISRDGGTSFEKPFPGAVVDRSREEPFFTASPYVMREGPGNWHMWYASGVGFVTDGASGVDPLYLIHYGHSENGVDWERPGRIAIEPHHAREANARATAIRDSDGLYKMWFCYRGSEDFRDGADAYQIGYAESEDAVHWRRDDERAGIHFSESGWDSTMQTYPNVCELPAGRFLFYNGNGFGATGIGVARWDK